MITTPNPNVLCEVIFPGDAPLSRVYDWLHESRRDNLRDCCWSRIHYIMTPILIGSTKLSVQATIQFGNFPYIP